MNLIVASARIAAMMAIANGPRCHDGDWETCGREHLKHDKRGKAEGTT